MSTRFNLRLSLILLVITSSVIFGFKIWPKFTHYWRESAQQEKLTIAATKLLDPVFYLQAAAQPSNFPRYSIEVSLKDINKIYSKLPDPNSGLMLTDESKIKVPAAFIDHGNKYATLLSLRGEQPPHWLAAKKSWRVEFVSNNFADNDSIDFIIPQERSYIADSISTFLAKQLSLPAITTDFVNLNINGVNFGLYVTENKLGIKFLQRHNLPLDSIIYGEQRSGVTTGPALFSNQGQWRTYRTDYLGTEPLGPIRKLQAIMQIPEDSRFFIEIVKIIDMDNFYRWRSHAEILGDYHQDNVHNNRLVYRSDTGKFMFVPNDIGINPLPLSGDLASTHALSSRILKNPEFKKRQQMIIKDYFTDTKNPQALLSYVQEIVDKVSIDLAKTPSRYKPVSDLMLTNTLNDLQQIITHNLNYLRGRI